jgi:hypothetical protein
VSSDLETQIINIGGYNMSSFKRVGPYDRIELRVFILRHYDHEKHFCASNDINYTTFRTLLAGHNGLPGVIKKIEEVILEHEYPLNLVKDPETYRFTDLRNQTQSGARPDFS